MQQLYILFDHALGYALFRVKEFEEVGMLLPELEKSSSDLSRFNSIVKLVKFEPYTSAQHALDNMNRLTEGAVPEELSVFLDTHLPKGGKRAKLQLGISDPKIGKPLKEILGVQCNHLDAVPEIIRAIRLHFDNMVEGVTKSKSGTARLGLGHSYSRSKVKFNVHRVDNMIIHSIAVIDQLDKDINTFTMKLREWYSYHFPELSRIISEHNTYTKVLRLCPSRNDVTEDKMQELEEIVMDSAKCQAILFAAKTSMGMDISPLDLAHVSMLVERVISLVEYRQRLGEYMRKRMTDVAPNLAALIGEIVGARLISRAGSLTNLAKYPASTVQILGAEKALFRALKARSKSTPKYGVLYHSSFIGRAEGKAKGRISRFLANKCSIASRIDCFSEIPSSIFGEKLKEQVEERLTFLSTGERPRKNLEVMLEAREEYDRMKVKALKKKKKQQRSSAVSDVAEEADEVEEPTPKKKKKKKDLDVEQELEDGDEVEDPTPKKKKKKKKNPEEDGEADGVEVEEPTPKKKKKKKRDLEEEQELEVDEAEEITPKKKKKKNDAVDMLIENGTAEEATPKKKKKKKSKAREEEED